MIKIMCIRANNIYSFFVLQFEKRIDGLIAERENMATEVWRLQQEVDRRRGDRSPSPRQNDPPRDIPMTTGQGSLDSFDPNHPRALQRKIGEKQCFKCYSKALERTA